MLYGKAYHRYPPHKRRPGKQKYKPRTRVFTYPLDRSPLHFSPRKEEE